MTQRICCLVLGLHVFLTTGRSQPYFQNVFTRQGFSFETGAIGRFPGGQIAIGGTQINELSGQKIASLFLLSSTGNLAWARQFDNTPPIERIVDLVVSPDNKMLVAFAPTYIEQGISGLVKIDLSGNMEWSRQTGFLTESFFRVAALNSGYLATGISGPFPTKGLIVRIGPDGQEIWRRTFEQPAGSIELYGAWEDEQGFLYVCGQLTSSGSPDGLLLKLNSNGDLEWMRRLGTGEIDALTEISPISGDRLLLGGYTYGLDAYARAWLTQADRSGMVKWSRSYQLAGDDIFLRGLSGQGATAALALSGVVSAPNIGAGLARVNTTGDLLWIKKFDPTGQIARRANFIPVPTDGYLLAADLQAGGSENLYVVHCNDSGDPLPCCFKSTNMIVADLTLNNTVVVPDAHGAPPLLPVNLSLVPLNTVVKTPLCDPPKLDFTLSDTSICAGECVDLAIVSPDPAINYAWSYPGGVPDPNMPGRVCFPEAAADISITLTANGCQQISKSLRFRPVSEQFPNAFTPNHDQVNDLFMPLLYCSVAAYHFMVFNRWGERMFETNEPGAGWDGSFNGQDAVSDVYAWVVEYQNGTQSSGRLVRKSGQVTLLR